MNSREMARWNKLTEDKIAPIENRTLLAYLSTLVVKLSTIFFSDDELYKVNLFQYPGYFHLSTRKTLLYELNKFPCWMTAK